ncbi:uncharacterized protein METZ01_LOCUS468680, partial [marine metagenome]
VSHGTHFGGDIAVPLPPRLSPEDRGHVLVETHHLWQDPQCSHLPPLEGDRTLNIKQYFARPIRSPVSVFRTDGGQSQPRRTS